jgi:hypothetical protein
MWIGLLMSLGYVTNTSRERDYRLGVHNTAEDTKEASEEGKTFCLLGLFCSLLALLLIFPIIFGPLGYLLGMMGLKQGALVWGRRTTRFALAATFISFAANLVIQLF